MTESAACPHPEDRIEWRKWPRLGAMPALARQCLECLERIDRRWKGPLDLPDDVDPAEVPMAKLVRKRGAGGLGGGGNSRRREYSKFMKSPKWRGPGGIRDQVLERDRNRCADCGVRATCVAHKFYRESIWDTRVGDCKASCDDCNQSERQQRIGGNQ